MKLIPVIAAAGLLCSLDAEAGGVARTWHTEPDFRWAPLEVPGSGKEGFTSIAPPDTGVVFTNLLAEASIAANRVLANGSGVAVGDFDSDGLPDLYFCGLESGNALYRNLGNWQFEDTTAAAGVACRDVASRGAVFADLNGDSRLDLLVSTLDQGVRCFLNQDGKKFIDHTVAAGLRSSFGSMTLALADVDGDGTLDLYIANNRPDDIRDRGRLNIPVVNGKPRMPAAFKDRLTVRDGQIFEFGQPDQLLLNDGTGRFRHASWTDGTFLTEAGQLFSAPPLDWGLTASFRDLNNDLAPDLYVCNDYWTPDRIWINDGNGRFKEIGRFALRPISSSSMGVDFADLDRDGDPDVFVADMLSRDPRLRKRQMFADKISTPSPGVIDERPQVMRNTLFQNLGDGTFAELAYYSGVVASDWSWSPIFLDVDLDGYEDLLISAGHFRDVQDLDAGAEIRKRQHGWAGFKSEAERQKAYTRELMEHYRLYPPLEMPIVAFRNMRDWKFDEATQSWGLDQPAIHHGMALGDFDMDGDLDLVANPLNSVAKVYKNESTAPRVAVRLKGLKPNTQGVGAKITLLNGAVPLQTIEVVSGGRYLSGSEPLAVFAAGEAKDGMSITVAWRNGATSTIREVQPNRLYEVDETNAEHSTQPAGDSGVASSGMPLFEDASSKLSHVHQEHEYNDFERQPLLPFKFSQQGPGLAWFDFDGDGTDELAIGSGSGGSPSVYRWDGSGTFSQIQPSLAPSIASDTAGLVGYIDENGNRALVAGITGYESPANSSAISYRFDAGRFAQGELVAGKMFNGGALALGDMNGTGQLALFVSGSVSPGRYPIGAPSKLYKRQHGKWQLDTRNSVLLDNIGVVNGAVWSDLNGDGLPELILACEWGPVRVFQNRNGFLFDATSTLGLAGFTGWWKGVTTGDLDGDGRLDIVAANWGLNTPYEATPAKPLTLFFGELAQPKVLDIVETQYDPVSGKLTPTRPFIPLASSLPFLFDRFASHQAYSEADLEAVLGERRVLARSVHATTLASMAFLNRGNRFEPVTLPLQAQLAPAFAVNVADFDGDGHEDLFLGQNFFPTQPEIPRLNAGRGLMLRGDGKGGFRAVPSNESGIVVHGEQRGAAVADYDGDGRIDIAVSQNGAATKLFRNLGAQPGLRIRLIGPVGNPAAYGAALRLVTDRGFGPVREIHGGSGYFSQDSSTQVMTTDAPIKSVWIRWPGGRETTVAVPSNARELAINSQGLVIAQQ